MTQFKPGDKAVIGNAFELNDLQVKICGVGTYHPEATYYIVELPIPNKDGWTHIIISEYCLEKL
jgi:hypothetical protein